MALGITIRGRLVAGLALFWACSLCQAANLSINPVLITLSNGQSIGALTLRNKGHQPVVLQVDVRSWNIESNRDRYGETDALIVTPPVFTVAPDQEQVVRVGLRHPAASDTEQSFRVFLEQAPATPANSANPDQAPTGIQVTLRIGIPVFIAPGGPVKREVEWHAERLDDGHLRIEAVNRGNVHVQVQRLALLAQDNQPLSHNGDLMYVLPGSRRHWTLELPLSAAPPYRIKARTKAGELEGLVRALP